MHSTISAGFGAEDISLAPLAHQSFHCSNLIYLATFVAAWTIFPRVFTHPRGPIRIPFRYQITMSPTGLVSAMK